MALTGNDSENKDNPRAILSQYKSNEIVFHRNGGQSCARHESHKSHEKLQLLIITIVAFGLISLGVWNLQARNQFLEQRIRILSAKKKCQCDETLRTWKESVDLEGATSTTESDEFSEHHGVTDSERHRRVLQGIPEKWRETRDDKNVLLEPRGYRKKADVLSENANDVHNDIISHGEDRSDGEASSSGRLFVDGNSKALSRHIRQAEESLIKIKDDKWVLRKLNKRLERDFRRQRQPAIFEAHFYDLFEFQKHFMEQECTDVTGKWNISATACRDGKIKFKRSGTALPFYKCSSCKDEHSYGFLDTALDNPGTFIVKKSGLYLLYLNITIISDNHFLAMFRNKRPTDLRCQISDMGHGHMLCVISGKLDLSKNDELEVRTMAPNMTVRLLPLKSVFAVMPLDLQTETLKCTE